MIISQRLEAMCREATFRAHSLTNTGLFSYDEESDLRQELLLDCYRRSKWFNGSRGSWKAFVRRVMRNRATELFRKRQKRARFEILVDALDNPAPKHEDVSIVHQKMDTQRIFDLLPSGLRDLARQLGSLGVAEICRLNGQSRSHIYRRMRKLRRAFQQAGYGLSSRPTNK